MGSEPTRIVLLSDGKRHRGYRDESGRFTLEQCNLSKSNEANNLVEYTVEEAAAHNLGDFDPCEYCYPAE